MKISPANNNYPFHPNNSDSLSFKGYYYEPPSKINRLDFYNGIEETPNRFFTSESLKHALSRPELLGKEGLKNIGRRIFKDARLMEAEASVYYENARLIQKKFRAEKRKNPDFYKNNIRRHGKPVQEVFDASELNDGTECLIGVDYSSDGNVFKVKKYKNEQVEKVTYASEFKRTGKVNHVEFWENGAPKRIEIGKRNLPGGVIKTDKLYEYSEDGRFLHSGMNVVEHPDHGTEMYNYVYPGFSQYDPNNIQRYCIKRVVNPDNTVTCYGLMVFKGKQYWCYIPEITFQKELENKPIFNSTLVEFDKKQILYYSYY